MAKRKIISQLPVFPFLIITMLGALPWAAKSIAFAGMPVVGEQAPDFVLPGLIDPQMLSLKDLKGKVVLLNIWASWCTSCKEEMEDLVAVQEQYGSRGFVLVAVNIDNAPSSALAFLQRLESKIKRKPALTFLYDKDKTVSQEYRQRSMPTSYVIDRLGIVRKVYPGSFSKSTLESLRSAIEEALK